MTKKGLSAEARTLRKRLLGAYDFADDPAALTLLDELILAVDQLRSVQSRLATDGLIVEGSAGQPRAHPLMPEQDRLRRTVLALTRSLRLALDEVIDA
jgi:hypothetical protein